MATIGDKLVELVQPVHRHLRARGHGAPARTRPVLCDECSQPVERAKKATSYGFPQLCRQCEIDH